MQKIEEIDNIVCSPHIAILSEETVEEDAEPDAEYYDIKNTNADLLSSSNEQLDNDFQLYERCQPHVAVHLLENMPDHKCLTVPIERPRHGDWYVFSYKHEPKRRRFWQRDGLQWRNYGLRKESYKERTLHKRYFRQMCGSASTTLSRIVYELVGQHSSPRFLIQYIDDTLTPKEVSVLDRVNYKVKKHTIGKDAQRRQLHSPLSDWQASELLVAALKGSCCHTPVNKPTSGYWYIYKYEHDHARSNDWMEDGLEWQQHSASTVHVGSALMLKRVFIRYIGGAAVDFRRYSYELVNPAAASLLGLGGDHENLASNLPSLRPLQDENTAPAAVGDSGTPAAKRPRAEGLLVNGENKSPKSPARSSKAGGKRSASWKRTPSKNSRTKQKKVVVKEEIDKSPVVNGTERKDEGGELPLYRVLVHYIGLDDAITLPPSKGKRFNTRASSGFCRRQLAVCRAVPLTCSDGTLQAAHVGPNRGIHRSLQLREAYRLLLGPPPPHCLNCLPLPHPRAGLWYVHEADTDAGSLSWCSDGLVWRLLSKTDHSVGEHQLLLKKYRRVVHNQPVHLYRYAYSVPSFAPSRVLLHYTGLDDEPEPVKPYLPHQLCKEEEGVEEEETGFVDRDSLDDDGRHQTGGGGEVKADSTTALSKDGLSVMVVTRLFSPLEMDAVIHLLEDTPEEDCLTFAPTNPKNGNWFVFSYAGLHHVCQKAYRKDHIRWRHNGTHKRVVSGKQLNIRYYKRVFGGRGARFMRYTYEILDSDGNNFMKRMLVHYLGKDDYDESMTGMSGKMKAKLGLNCPVLVKVGDLAEGKFYTVQCTRFIPDCELFPPLARAARGVDEKDIRQAVASILELENVIREDGDIMPQHAFGTVLPSRSKATLHTGFDSYNNFYYEEIMTTDAIAAMPTNVVEEVSLRYSSDDADTSVDSGMPYVYRMNRNTIELLHTFLLRIKDTHGIFYQLIPATIVVISCKANIIEFKTMCEMSATNILVFYDKTWRVGGLYVSCLYTKHVQCESESLFPLAFAIHELDDADIHSIILQQISVSCKFVNSPEVLVLTDATPSILNACFESLPKCMLLSSWSNVIEAVKLWYARNDPTSDAWVGAVEAVTKLLKTLSVGEYTANYQEVTLDWSPDFKAFYDESLAGVVTSSTAGNLQNLGMFSSLGLTIDGSRDFLEQMDNLFQDTDVASVDALTNLAYYVLYYYQSEIEKGKLTEVGTAFKRKGRFSSQVSKKKCFFPTRCALTEDIAAAILHKMKVPQFLAKKEPHSVLLDDYPDSNNMRELVNIEIDLDDNLSTDPNDTKEEMLNGIAYQFTMDEDKPMQFEENITCLEEEEDGQTSFIYLSRNEDDTSMTSPVIQTTFHSLDTGKSGLRLAPKSVLFEEVTEIKLEDDTVDTGDKDEHLRLRKAASNLEKAQSSWNSGISKSRSGPKCTAYYARRKRIINLGHSLWNSSRVSYDSRSDTYIVRGSRGRVDVARLTPRRVCSCNARWQCQHLVAALLESLCQRHSSTSPVQDLTPTFVDDKSDAKTDEEEVVVGLQPAVVLEEAVVLEPDDDFGSDMEVTLHV